MRRILYWTVALLVAACTVATLGPESAHARGGGGMGGGRGSRGRRSSNKDKKERKNLLLRLQRDQAEEARDDFRAAAVDETMVKQREAERAASLEAQREAGARSGR